jgi:hypothetical protein
MNLSSESLVAIDKVIQRVNGFRVEPEFTNELKWRIEGGPDFSLPDEKILARMIDLIAYSNNAPADKVGKLIESDILRTIFHDYSIEKIAESSPEQIRQQYWSQMTAIRFKYKVDRMIACAARLRRFREQHRSFMAYVNSVGLPSAVKSEQDVRSFWGGFNAIISYLWRVDFPYFKNFTSLCHLLMDLGFDCAKPDLAVMKAAVDLKIVPAAPAQKKDPTKTGLHPEKDLHTTVEAIQSYALRRDTRAPVVDLYLLIHGGQLGVRGLVQNRYYAPHDLIGTQKDTAFESLRGDRT